MPKWPWFFALFPIVVQAQQPTRINSGYGAAPGFVVESWTITDGLPVNSVTTVLQSRSGYIWLGTFDGLVRFDGVRFTTFNIGNSPGLPSNRIVYVDERSNGDLMLRTESNRVVRFRDGVFTDLGPSKEPWPHLPERFVARTPDGKQWSSINGEVFFDGKLAYRPPPGLGNTMAINSMAVDHEGSIWFGTVAAGLFQLKPATFNVYTINDTRGANNLYSITPASGGGVWAGEWLTYVSRINNGRVTSYGRENGVPPGVTSLFEDSKHRLWLGSVPCKLPEFKCRQLPGAPQTIINALHEANDGTIWLGTPDGLYLYHDSTWSHPRPEDNAPKNVRAFLTTSDGALWMATNGFGIVRMMDGKYTSVTTREGLPSDVVRSLYQDSDGWLWVGTEGKGLARLDPKDWNGPGKHGRIVNIRAQDGLFDDGIHVILEDSSRRLWMSTNRGIFHVSRADLNAFADGKISHVRSTGYTERDGLINREGNGGNQPAGTRSSDGKLWFATQDGAAVVDPSKVGGGAVAPRVVVERVIAGGKAVDIGSAIEIPPDRRDLQIEYTALSYLAPGSIRFRYRLIPYDRDWIDADTRRTATYTRVPPGHDTFEVVASNGEDVWTRAPATVAFGVTPRFYETGTFRLLVLLALILLVWAAVRWRLTRLRNLAVDLQSRVDERTRELRQRETLLAEQNTKLESQADQLQELDRAKSRFFANVSHELRTPLTLTIGPIEDARAQLTENGSREVISRLDMALRNSRRLFRLVNQILDVSKLEAGGTKLRAQRDDLAEFVKGLAAAFSGFAERKGISFQVDAPDGGIEAWFDHDALDKVVANLLSNAFKFTPDRGSIRVSVDAPGDGSIARVRVSDSGPGIPAEHLPHIFDRFYQVDETNTRAQPGTGIGLSLARELTELHGGTLEVESGSGGGATFTLSIPTGRAHLSDDQIASTNGDRASITERIELIDAEHETDGDNSHVASSATASNRGDDITTLLVVDDNADLRSYVRSRFVSRYRVIEAADGADALLRAREIVPDLVISDVMMPGTDGHALCAALRASPETDFIPVILLTALADQAERIAGLGRGADDYIVKPFDMRELEARVVNLISSRRLLRERFSGKQVQLRTAVDADSAADKEFITRVRSAIETNISDPDFGVNELARAVFQERTYLFRRVREVFEETPSDLLRRLRLERSKGLLEDGRGSIAEVAYGSGFNSVSHFCRIFRAAYGVTPTEWRDGVRRA
jgi:signal transduction histidine kinase/DNA-binding response OmpR family regulator/ligand-binding sensor domain-containing protein